MALAGGILGFLHFNMPPARMYMGDGGSFLLGFMLAILVIAIDWSDSSGKALAAGVLVLAFPVYDLTVTSILRLRHGICRTPLDVIAYSDTDHLSHRLRKMGFSQRGMLLVLCSIHAACCGLALAIVRCPLGLAACGVILLLLFLTGFAIHVDRRSSTPDLWQCKARAKDG